MKTINHLKAGKIGDKFIIFPTDAATEDFSGFVELNETGYEIWCGIEKGLSPQEIAESFTKNYTGVSYDEAYEYTEQTISKLVENGIVIER